MRSLRTLIKLHKQTLDQLRRALAVLESQKAQLQQAIVRLKEELQHELALAGKTPELGAFFGDFAKRVRAREEALVMEIRKLDEQMNELREKIRIEFGEQKKYEIALEQRMQARRAKQNKLEQELLDEIALQQHGRKES